MHADVGQAADAFVPVFQLGGAGILRVAVADQQQRAIDALDRADDVFFEHAREILCVMRGFIDGFVVFGFDMKRREYPQQGDHGEGKTGRGV